jgi:pyrroloquinoline quinone (PQQ) biosynthesis protein C
VIQPLRDLVREILAESDHMNLPFLKALRDGTMSHEEFIETQVQFYSAVAFFASPMAVLAARIHDESLREGILRNVAEEGGEGDITKSHRATFLEFIRRIGGPEGREVLRRPVWPEVKAFNAALSAICATDDHAVGAAVMGMIEAMFSGISAAIGQGTVARGWIAPDAMIHYDLHEELDVRHAEDFFKVVDVAWSDRAKRPHVERGLRLGVSLFSGLYAGLYAGRSRRSRNESHANLQNKAGR